MAIRKKGSRPIVVDGETYRWRIRRRPTHDQSNWTALVVAVQHTAGNGSNLIIHMPFARPDNYTGMPSGIVTPAVAARCIRDALGQGWEPTNHWEPFFL
jgi:hypothetical protein